MTDASPSPEDLADESNWTLIANDDEVWSPRAELPPPLADPSPPLLNPHEMGWEPFERLVLAMARSLDGACATPLESLRRAVSVPLRARIRTS